jgi:hypothetical protein
LGHNFNCQLEYFNLLTSETNVKKSDSRGKILENSINNEPGKPSDDTNSSVDPDIITPKQQIETMETTAHHLYKAPGKNLYRNI